MHSTLKDLLILAAITVLILFLYHRIPATYFCGYDDFIEIHRAAFLETQQPIRVLTDTHFNSYKYRPGSHGLHFLTYRLSNGNPLVFRVRNIACHVINIVLLYGIGLLLFRSRLISGVAALLFALHPLVNQPVVIASFTIPAAHVAFLFALFSFLYSIERKQGSLTWLCVSLFSGWLGILIYESSISVFPLMFVYLLITFITRRQKPSLRFVLVWITGTVLFTGSYFVMRYFFVAVSARHALSSLKTMVLAAVLYTVGLLSPVDSVLANEWFGIPLPSEIQLGSIGKIWWALILGGVFAALAGIVLLRRPIIKRLKASEWANILFLLLAIVLSLLPLIVVTPKPSETYAYLGVAFFALVFSALLEALIRPSLGGRRLIIYATVVGALTISFSCATWIRNTRVVHCGETAQRILTGLRDERLEHGVWFLKVASVPGEPKSRRYGIYGWKGVDAIGGTGLDPAVQWINDNELLASRLIESPFRDGECTGSHDVCFWIHEDGTVEAVNQSVAR